MEKHKWFSQLISTNTEEEKHLQDITFVDDIKMAGATQNMPKLWTQSRIKVDLCDPVFLVIILDVLTEQRD